MNEDMVMQMIAPYVVDEKLSYTSVDRIFQEFSDRKKELIYELVESSGITLVDDEFISDDIIDDDEIFLSLVDNVQNDIYEIKGKYTIPNFTLVRLIQSGNKQAKQQLCILNRKLVYKCALYYSKFNIGMLEFEDLVQVGMIGLLRAADKFDFRERVQFATYANWWIRQAISREILDRSSIIRIPVHMMDRISKIYKLYNKYKSIGRYGDIVMKISSELGMDVEDVEYSIMIKTLYVNFMSLDEPIGDNNSTPLMNVIKDEAEESVEDIICKKILHNLVCEIVDTLKDKEKAVIRMRFGLVDGNSMTLEEIGEKFGVSRERIRQIEKTALHRLRYPARSERLKDFLE